jgi:hypothetical protein
MLLALVELTEQFNVGRGFPQVRCQISRGEVQRWMKKNGTSISSVAYSGRQRELKEMDLITLVSRKDHGEDMILTEKGLKVARLVREFTAKVGFTVQEENMVAVAT